MKRLTLILFVAVLNIPGDSYAQQQVERKGQSSQPKLEQVISGHLTELNGKYKLRATETTFEPGGYIGEHHHIGPGLRFVASGALTFVKGGQDNDLQGGRLL